MRLGLFFGSFDPIHRGHLALGTAAYKQANFDAVWFVLTPHSPAKQANGAGLSAKERLLLLRLALWGKTQLQASDVELKLPSPQYTADTLRQLNKQYPQHHFSVIMGADSLAEIHTWKDVTWLLAHYSLYVYGRKGSAPPKQPILDQAVVHHVQGPLSSISSTQLRTRLHMGQTVSAYLPAAVLGCIQKKKFYR